MHGIRRLAARGQDLLVGLLAENGAAAPEGAGTADLARSDLPALAHREMTALFGAAAGQPVPETVR